MKKYFLPKPLKEALQHIYARAISHYLLLII